jgi:hypothetical protein
MTAPKKPGRPKLPEGQALTKVLAARVPIEDFRAIRAHAKRRKVSVSQMVKDIMEAFLFDGEASETEEKLSGS